MIDNSALIIRRYCQRERFTLSRLQRMSSVQIVATLAHAQTTTDRNERLVNGRVYRSTELASDIIKSP